MKIAFLASGNLGYKTIKTLLESVKPTFIATDSGSQDIVHLATQKAIPVFKGNPRNGRLAEFMKSFRIDILLSINYLFLLDPDVISKAKYTLNLHGSLLPKYRGRSPHVWAIINNEKYTGVTAHFIDENCDTGDIVMQKEIAIPSKATGADLLKLFEDIYPHIVKDIIYNIKYNKLTKLKQDHSKATYYGKRTPEDGNINWDWQKERIYNWIKAQAYPYPGAFTKFEGNKIVIDKINFSDQGYEYSDPNGLILKQYPNVIVKTPNGAIKLLEVREGNEFLIKGTILGR